MKNYITNELPWWVKQASDGGGPFSTPAASVPEIGMRKMRKV
jgi:hypothetical protein